MIESKIDYFNVICKMNNIKKTSIILIIICQHENIFIIIYIYIGFLLNKLYYFVVKGFHYNSPICLSHHFII